MRKLIIFLIVIVLGIGLNSCKQDSSDKLAQDEIREILYSISTDFNLKNMYEILEHLHTEYLHKGKIAHHFNINWLEYMGRFSLLDIEVLYIEIQDNKAVAHTKNTFSSAYETEVHNEPEDNGEISYFYRENGVWYVYGNQQWAKKGVQRTLPCVAKK
ncbi:MAG: hypothetical protein PHY48_03550 [Candidatus Cloacimonetes bacterium]|nr:hypothetical protein [Candidatus Cloacimonadota bacterium]